MMKKSVVRSDLHRAIKCPRFVMAVIIMFFIWEWNSYRFQTKEDVMYLYIHVWNRAITPLLAMVVTSFAYAGSCCEDLESHFQRYCILRVGVKEYVRSRILVCFCSAFLTLFSGTLLFVLRQSFVLPLAAENSAVIQNFQDSCMGNIMSESPLLYIVLQTSIYGFYCGGIAVLTLGFSPYIRNSHGIFVIPFLLDHLFEYLTLPLLDKFPRLSLETIYSGVLSYTMNTFGFLITAVFVTVMMIMTGYKLMYSRMRKEYQ